VKKLALTKHRSEEIERDAVVEVQVAEWSEDRSRRGRTIGFSICTGHHVRRKLHDAADPRFADEHVVRFAGK
jgi:hypothetical protein